MDKVHAIKMRSVEEGSAIYYIGDFGIAPPDTLRFTLKISGVEVGKAHKIEFQKNFPAP